MNVYSSAGAVALPSHLTSYTPTKCNTYLESSLDTVVRELSLYILSIHSTSAFNRNRIKLLILAFPEGLLVASDLNEMKIPL
jgi:hypothetical protein